MSYNSKYTGKEVDEGLDKAFSSLTEEDAKKLFVEEYKRSTPVEIPSDGFYVFDVNNQFVLPENWNGSTDDAVGVAVIQQGFNFVIAKEDVGLSQWGGAGVDILIPNIYEPEEEQNGGYEYTQQIIKQLKPSIAGTCAAYDCSNYIFPNGQNGYLGSAKEWLIVQNNLTQINSIFERIGVATIGLYNSDEDFWYFEDDYQYWTSTESQIDLAIGTKIGLPYSFAPYLNKGYYNKVRAFMPFNVSVKKVKERLEALENEVKKMFDDNSTYFIKLDSDDLVGVYNEVRQKFEEGCKLFYSRPPGLAGVSYFPCNIQVGDDYVVVQFSFNYSDTILSKSIIINSSGVVHEEATNICVNGDFDNGFKSLDLYINGKGDKFLTDDGTYKEIGGQNIPVIDHGTGDTTFVLTPNIFHKWGTVTSLTITLAAPVDTTVANYYMFEFTSGSTATTLSLPSAITWASDVSIEANKTYQVSILNGCGIIGGF